MGGQQEKRRRAPSWPTFFANHGQSYRRAHRLPASHLKVMRAVEVCRTQELGGHLKQCDTCGFEHPTYNSCRNRHCPKCQSLAKAKWLRKQNSELLPVGYFHLVFTLPHELNRLILAHKKLLLALLFKAVSETLLEFGQRRFGATSGSSPCFIPGIKPSKIIFISIVWSLPELCPSITTVGSLHAKTFCSPLPL